MLDPKPLSTLVFDVNETLLDITVLETLFLRLFGDASVLRDWFAELILYSQTMTLSGRYIPFGALAGGVLRMIGTNRQVTVQDADIAELNTLMASMPAHPDVTPSLKKLRDAGFTLVTLSNSAPSSAPTPLETAGVSMFFEAHFSVDEVRKFKPHPATYKKVAACLNVELSQICLVACHLWDTIGAQSVGCRGAFITRPHNSLLLVDNVPRPDFISTGLTEFTEQILAVQKNTT